MSAEKFSLSFGTSGRFEGQVAAERLAGRFTPPASIVDLQAAVAAAAGNPPDYPPLHQSLVPGDHVMIVLDRSTPRPAEVIAGLFDEFAKRGIDPSDVTIMQPVAPLADKPEDPRSALPAAAREAVRWHVHDPLPDDSCAYVATTAAGERIYLSKELVASDVTILVSAVEFDRLWGYRGLQSALFPGLSNIESLRKAHGQPHEELQADDVRPIRQKADEIAWLLGVHFAVGIVPGAEGGASQVFAGPAESVLKQSQEALNQHWRFSMQEPAELVLVSVDADATGHTWTQLATALEAAKSLVAKDGKIGVLSELKAPLSEGLQLIRDSRKPRDAMRPLREQSPPDLTTATALAKAVEWANVYLLSELDPDLVEEMFMVPLANADEVQRLIAGEDSIAVIGSAQHVCTDELRTS
ncbi:MAG TPA: lactate racemase domain-containing protein [Caulifigura sp.]|jgi:nickel-dependent lactate racemase|nr:lactate racemase domain-containing protein [Caulifigura sp.]